VDAVKWKVVELRVLRKSDEANKFHDAWQLIIKPTGAAKGAD
jgi:hypothetical protein